MHGKMERLMERVVPKAGVSVLYMSSDIYSDLAGGSLV